MAEKRTRRRFTAEFKAQAAKRLLDGGKGLSEVATELGLSAGQLIPAPGSPDPSRRLPNTGQGAPAGRSGIPEAGMSPWRSEHLAAGSAEALAQRRTEEAETQRLRREVRRLEEENLILRKAAAVFAKGIA